MAAEPGRYEKYLDLSGAIPAPCRLMATLDISPNGMNGGMITHVDLAGWDVHGEPMVILDDGRLGGLTRGMKITGVRAV